MHAEKCFVISVFIIYLYLCLLFEFISFALFYIKHCNSKLTGLFKFSNPDRPLTVRQGRKLTMSAENEESLRTFCDHAWQMGMPRTQDMLSEDIRDFSVRKNIPCPYKVRGPGMFCTYLNHVNCKGKL